jgi:hypothetical protein
MVIELGLEPSLQITLLLFVAQGRGARFIKQPARSGVVALIQ